MRNEIQCKIWGKYALFSDPVTRVGGEKYSMQVPSYQALKGMVESIYWKPTFIWYIDAVRVLHRIQSEDKHILACKFPAQTGDRFLYTYLYDVAYQIKAHFEWNPHRPELAQDRNEHKHHNIARRMVERGGRRDIFLGTRECQGYVAPCVFGEGAGFYDDYGSLSLGMGFHSFAYPDETGTNSLGTRHWHISMQNGMIHFPRPEVFSETSTQYPLRILRTDVVAKRFVSGVNFCPLSADLDLSALGEELCL